MRLAVATAVSCFLISSLSATEYAAAAFTQQTEIPAQNLGSALEALAHDRRLQLIYATEDVGSRHSEGAVGNLSTDDALRRILKGTGLSYLFLDDNTITVQPASPSPHKGAAIPEDRSSDPTSESPWDKLRLAQAPGGKSVSSAAGGSSTQDSPVNPGEESQLGEILVSAQKRGEERLQDTPIPISVLNAEALISNSQVLLRDYYTSVPGLSVAPNIEAQQMLAIRGITTGGGGNPTVGVLIDDIPYGSSLSYGGNTIPDVDPSDLDRIEVLRGPQGTLYGANSMGGLIKYVTKDPSTDGYSGRIEAGASHVYNGAEPGYDMRASVNIPLGDTLAVRASAFTRQDPGYIDNIAQNIQGINEAQTFGARAAALWKPWDIFSVKLSALYQETRGNGVPEIDEAVNGYKGPPIGDLQQDYVAGVDRYSVVPQLYSAVIKLKLDAVDLTSETGYSINRTTSPFDFSPTFGATFEKLYGVSGAPLITDINLHKISQEFRVSGGIGSSFDWLVGAFYTHEEESPREQQTIYESNATTGQVVGVFYDADYLPTFQEYAAFGDLTYHFNDQFNVQLGVRESRNQQTFTEVTTGPFVAVIDHATSPLTSGADTDGSAFTYLVTPQFKLSADLMVYARLASGYRPGGSNLVPTTTLPASYNPDRTYNYEVGLKGDFLDKKLSVDASVYYIDWKNLQVNLHQIYAYTSNASSAKSEGVELAVDTRPLSGLTVSGWIDYDDAVLTRAFPSISTAYGVAGDRLPNTAKYSANLSLQQEFSLSEGYTGFAGATGGYIGSREGLFTASSQRSTYGGYTRTDLRAGVKHDGWTTNLYVNNVADIRGITSGGLGYYIPYAYTVIEPRTIGVSVSRVF